MSEKLPSLALPLIVLVVGCLLAVGCWLLAAVLMSESGAAFGRTKRYKATRSVPSPTQRAILGS